MLWRFTQIALKGDEHPAVVKGIQLAKDGYFAGFQPLADQMRKQSAEGTPFAMSQQQWVDTTTPQLFTLLEIMYGAGEASEAHTAEAGSAALRSLMLSLALLGAAAGGLFIAGWVVTRLIVRPIKDLTLCMRTLAGGNVDAPVLGLGRADEIGEMASAVQVFKDNIIETQRLRAEQAETEQSRIRQRKEEMSRMADAFEGAVGNIVDAVSSTSTELEAAAGALTSTAERAQSLSGMVATASDSASANVGSVASASEQMASSINEIGRQVQEVGSDRQRSGAAGAADQRSRQCVVTGGQSYRRRG